MQVIRVDVGTKDRILLAVQIASRCGQALSINEIALILPSQKDTLNIQETIRTDPGLSESVSIEEEFVVLKGYEHLFSERTFREKITHTYREIGAVFVKELERRSPYIELIGVCGSVAYGSAKYSDDIDLFIITEKNRMWLSFLKALLLARIFNIKASINGAKTDFCLSYVQDKKHFEDEITHNRASLFAREFLSLFVVDGTSYYSSLLEKADWMREAYPLLYASKLGYSKNEAHVANLQLSVVRDVLNLFIYSLLGGFLRIKAFLRNLKYRKQCKMKDLFDAEITKGSCVYISERYRELEALYNLSYSSG